MPNSSSSRRSLRARARSLSVTTLPSIWEREHRVYVPVNLLVPDAITHEVRRRLPFYQRLLDIAASVVESQMGPVRPIESINSGNRSSRPTPSALSQRRRLLLRSSTPQSSIHNINRHHHRPQPSSRPQRPQPRRLPFPAHTPTPDPSATTEPRPSTNRRTPATPAGPESPVNQVVENLPSVQADEMDFVI